MVDCPVCEHIEHLIDELLWAIDHRGDSRAALDAEAHAIVEWVRQRPAVAHDGAGCAHLDDLLDRLIWAADHIDDEGTRREAFTLITHARIHNLDWHQRRARRYRFRPLPPPDTTLLLLVVLAAVGAVLTLVVR